MREWAFSVKESGRSLRLEEQRWSKYREVEGTANRGLKGVER